MDRNLIIFMKIRTNLKLFKETGVREYLYKN